MALGRLCDGANRVGKKVLFSLLLCNQKGRLKEFQTAFSQERLVYQIPSHLGGNQ